MAKDSGAAESVQDGSGDLANRIPSAPARSWAAGEAFVHGLAIFTVIFLTLFLVIDMPRQERARPASSHRRMRSDKACAA